MQMNSENLAAIFSFFSTTEDIIRQYPHYLGRNAQLFNLKSCICYSIKFSHLIRLFYNFLSVPASFFGVTFCWECRLPLKSWTFCYFSWWLWLACSVFGVEVKHIVFLCHSHCLVTKKKYQLVSAGTCNLSSLYLMQDGIVLCKLYSLQALMGHIKWGAELDLAPMGVRDMWFSRCSSR